MRFRTSKFWYKNQIKNFSNEPFSTIIELSTDTLMGETKRVATQNSKFEDSVNSVWKSFFGTLVQTGFWCNKKNRLNFNRLICDNSKKIERNLDATNQTWKFRENWVIISISAKVHRMFCNFRTIRFLLQGRKSTSFQPKRLLKLFLSDWNRDGRYHASTNGETWFWKARWFKTKNLQCVFGHQYFNKRIKLKISQSIFLPNLELSIDTLMGETKPIDSI